MKKIFIPVMSLALIIGAANTSSQFANTLSQDSNDTSLHLKVSKKPQEGKKVPPNITQS